MVEEAVHCGLCEILLLEDERLEEYAELIRQAESMGAQLVAVSTGVMQGLCAAKAPQGIVCIARVPTWPGTLQGELLLALDAVQDPGNLGTIVRTADAAGFCGVILGRGCADPTGPKALQATMGSIFRMPIARSENLEVTLTEYAQRGYSVVASMLGGTDFYAACPSCPAVLVIGNEGNGISEAVARTATVRLALPMRGGAESLNAAVAAGIMMYELSRRT